MILKKSDCSGKQSSMDGGGGMGSGIGLDILRLTLCPSYFVSVLLCGVVLLGVASSSP